MGSRGRRDFERHMCVEAEGEKRKKLQELIETEKLLELNENKTGKPLELSEDRGSHWGFV
ncbi:hypothetical protein F2Q69_00046853 [Brassica cretica]|uniref:Uncharacterized protein n=1 Tax=Brassica cretica TaxID=69181 RepID=A0A8S9PRA3_BRACR|nr:hypothetical protein F2Q69_00046853 [Brassica cretica]